MKLASAIIALAIIFFLVRFLIRNARLRRLVGFDVRPNSDLGRPPLVLYLRAFQEDATTDVTPLATRHEEMLVSVLQEFGEVVAIGRPGEKAPPPGAKRIYADNRTWKEKVKGLMQAAQVVVIQADTSKGLLWEVAAAVSAVRPQRLLISLPYKLNNRNWISEDHQETRYYLFRNEVEKIFPVSLPESTGRATFLCFNANWKPVRLNPPSPWLWIFGQFPRCRVGIREAIRPFCKRRGFHLNRRQAIFKSIAYFPLLGPPILMLTLLYLFVLIAKFIQYLLALVGLLD